MFVNNSVVKFSFRPNRRKRWKKNSVSFELRNVPLKYIFKSKTHPVLFRNIQLKFLEFIIFRHITPWWQLLILIFDWRMNEPNLIEKMEQTIWLNWNSDFSSLESILRVFKSFSHNDQVEHFVDWSVYQLGDSENISFSFHLQFEIYILMMMSSPLE